jgi:hypothetical protein
MRVFVAYVTCFFFSGCLGFGYPDLSRTPAVTVDSNEVHAFRVLSQATAIGPIITSPVWLRGSVEEIPVMSGMVGPQGDADFAYYFVLFPLLEAGHSRTLEVLLYRPGYETVVIPAHSWWLTLGREAPEKVAWKEAPDLLAQKEALDRIVEGWSLRSLNKGVLEFLAQEYERLANSELAAAPTMAPSREKLRFRARECHDLASENASQKASSD